MFSTESLSGKVVFVTGASRGIGQGIAKQLGQMGATVVGSATSSDGAERISAFLADNNIKGYGVSMNLADPAGIETVVKEIEQENGGLNILVNNAGITRDNLMLRMKPEEWQAVIDTNLSGLFYLTKSCLKGMIKARWGRIISISSVVGLMGNAGQANYAAAKAGVIGFSKSLAREVASRGVTVNVVAPGFIQTDMTDVLPAAQKEALLNAVPIGQLGQVSDIAASVAFLASEGARYITGETLQVNGGMYMS